MRSFPIRMTTTLTPSRLISAITVVFLFACFVPAIIGSLQAEESSSDGVTFIAFAASPVGPDEWMLEGYISGGDRSSVSIVFSGAASGSTSLGADGYFYAFVQGAEGIVYAEATYLSETATMTTELSGQSS